MLQLTVAEEVELRRVESRDTIPREGGVGVVVRLHLAIQDLDGNGLIDKLPLSGSIRTAIKEAASIADGKKNSPSIDLKLSHPTLEYQFGVDKEQLARFEADVKTIPRVKIVEGVAALEFKIEGTVDPAEVAALSSHIGHDGVNLMTSTPVDPQQDLNL